MAGRKRRGMIIKNTHTKPVAIEMRTRSLVVHPGEEYTVTAEEVRDAGLREMLQIRAISIVRPSTEAEEDALRRQLADGEQAEEWPGEE